MLGAQAGFQLTSQPLPLRDLLRNTWAARSLIRLLAKQEFFARYRRASLGLVWAVGLPATQAVVLAVVFSRVTTFDVGGNYWLFVFAGMIPWSFFIGAVDSGATAIVSGSPLASKTYFPRVALPIVSVGTEVYGFLCSAVVLLGAVIVVGDGVGVRALLLVPATALAVGLAVSFGIVLSALHVYFRDTEYVVHAASRAWFFVTPVVFPLTLADGWLRTAIEANPATGIVLLFRASVFPVERGWEVAVWWSIAWVAALLVLGAILHRRFDRVFVDLL